MSTASYTTDPNNQGMDPQLVQDLEQIEMYQQMVEEDRKKILALAAAMSTMANPLYGVQLMMNELMGEQGDQVSGLSAADNLDSDVRGDISSIQNVWNKMSGQSGDGTPKTVDIKDVQDFLNQIQQLVNFLGYAGAQGEGIDSSTIKTMLDGIGSMPIFNNPGQGQSPTMMSPSDLQAAIQKWNNATVPQPDPSNPGKMLPPESSPQVQQMQNGMQTCNQSVSSISTSTNTQLQFVAEQYKQFLGIDQDVNQSVIQMEKQEISNQKGV